jgi:hypothetical protein
VRALLGGYDLTGRLFCCFLFPAAVSSQRGRPYIEAGVRISSSSVVGLIGREQMKESRVIEEFQEEARVELARQYILDALEARFGSPGPDLTAALNGITESKRLNQLHQIALKCSGLKQFRDRLKKI